MRGTPRGMRLHIGLLGRRNVGKSSLINALAHQDLAIVSDVAGTTTDPVLKSMELQPLGPVVFVDTAGIDDVGELGEKRRQATRKMLDRLDLALLVIDRNVWGVDEQALLAELQQRGLPIVVVCNKVDQADDHAGVPDAVAEANIACVATSATTNRGMDALRQRIVDLGPRLLETPTIVGDLVPPGELAVLVVPIDMEAPKGRLILPQVQTIRDLLDHDAACVVVKERELAPILDRLREPPALVVTDSQAFLRVHGDTPPKVHLTSFSILFARLKGDLDPMVRGAVAIETLKTGSKILMAEACTHHPIGDDIGRVKIPRWLRQYVGQDITIDHVQGHDFPDDLAGYDLVIHCGSCTLTRRQVLGRIRRCQQASVPISNYGLTIAYTLGIFDRALQPFPSARLAYEEATQALAHPAKTL